MFNLYSHGGSGNHGCEAIVRSTIKVLNENSVNVFSHNVDQDVKYGIDDICNLQKDTLSSIQRGSLKWLLSSIQSKITGRIDLKVKYQRKLLFENIHSGDICFSVGGDNYCYAGVEILGAVNHCLRKKHCKTVLWGCSVEPELLNNQQVINDISKFDLITARESISYQALKRINNNTYLIPDSAFTLDRIDLPLPTGWKENNTIGVNASPLILSSGNNENIVMEAYRKLIITIIENTDSTIALIPHVVWDNNDDREILKQLYEEFKDTGRLVLVDDFNCMQLKGYIARCRMFIGARTHATIAAYSSCVPTLVLGYSVKSRGIAKDLFGTDKNYVISVQGMKDTNLLSEGFLWLLENEKSIKSHLHSMMPDYVNRVYNAGTLVQAL
ncbi:polysaccharide pyruvyl transferase family protein [Blautia sp. HCP3S3_D9]|uniref:polysaccharide pyruvyl transferase family protein n=1 Tax=Blautia sp. HCP3S3_D9 TaxID=3438912 RepID=UPI003F88B28E